MLSLPRGWGTATATATALVTDAAATVVPVAAAVDRHCHSKYGKRGLGPDAQPSRRQPGGKSFAMNIPAPSHAGVAVEGLPRRQGPAAVAFVLGAVPFGRSRQLIHMASVQVGSGVCWRRHHF
jgi:hypothetical protein